MRILLTSLIFLISLMSYSQIIFQEPFDETPLSTSGTDNVGGVNWATACPSCLDANDWFHIVSGKLDGRDTNGPATFTTSTINTSACTDIEISVDISETGTMEGCGTGCNSVDWVSLQYRVDGGAWTDPTNSYFCLGGCAGLNVVQDDDVTGSITFTSDCFPAGNNLELRISVQSWAATEYWEIDNVVVNCLSCVALPIDLFYFDGENIDNVNKIKWITYSEINNDYFTLENSIDGINWEVISYVSGVGNSTDQNSYYYDDYTYKKTRNYYRLTQTDFNGESEVFDVIVIDNREREKYIIKIVNMMGQEVDINYDGIKVIIYDDNTVIKKY